MNNSSQALLAVYFNITHSWALQVSCWLPSFSCARHACSVNIVS